MKSRLMLVFLQGIGNAFIVSESGRAYMNFGDFRPGTSEGTGVFDGTGYNVSGRYSDDEGGNSGDSGLSQAMILLELMIPALVKWLKTKALARLIIPRILSMDTSMR